MISTPFKNLLQSKDKVFTYLRKTLPTVGRSLWALAQQIQTSWQKLTAQPGLVKVGAVVKRYSVQLSFTLLTIIFLSASVGEGQAYDPSLFAASSPETDGGFVGKAQVFEGETVLTGEVQQSIAIVYRVEKGDSLLEIADRYSTSVGTILEANNIAVANAEKIQPGTEILIPAEDTNPDSRWLAQLNDIKEKERIQAEKERQKKLAAQNRNRLSLSNLGSRISAGSGYAYIGTMRLPYNGGYPGQCTNYVLYKRPDLPRQMGNGGQYVASARAYGIPTGRNAVAGAVYVSKESSVGHVGYVESVGEDSFTITDMNYLGPYKITRRVISKNSPAIIGFVYWK